MFLFQFVKQIIETVIEIYKILLIWWVDPQYPWFKVIGSPIWGSSMTRVNIGNFRIILPLLVSYFDTDSLNMLEYIMYPRVQWNLANISFAQQGLRQDFHNMVSKLGFQEFRVSKIHD